MLLPAHKIVDQYGRPIPRMASDFEGAATGRRMGSWGTSSAGVNSTLFSSLNTLRSRSRELRRNNPLIDGGVDTYAANIIGSGINPRWRLDDKVLKKEIQELWGDWIKESDLLGINDFYGQQTLGANAMIDAGEFLSRFVTVGPGEYNSVPLKIQLLEADHLDASYYDIKNNNEVRMGIEIDKLGRRLAYWIWNEHPGELLSFRVASSQRVRVLKEDMTHVFKPVRIGQMRGRPWLSSIIVKMHELDQYSDAELVRKKAAAMFGGFIIEKLNYENNPSSGLGREVSNDTNGNTIIALEPGTFPELPIGKEVQFSQPVDVGITYEAWIKQQLREIATGMGITYEQLTTDLTGVNYSSIRAGLLEFRRRINQLQHQIIIHQFCRPIAERWMDTVVLCGAIKIKDYYANRRKYLRIEWRPDGWDWVDPVKDQLGEQMAIRNGFKSRTQVVAERNNSRDIEKIDEEIEEDNKRADGKGLVYDSDPRRTSASGAMQTVIEEVMNPQNKGKNNE
jgi:lambda family phage portal protein